MAGSLRPLPLPNLLIDQIAANAIKGQLLSQAQKRRTPFCLA
jgi:hypothetical protein